MKINQHVFNLANDVINYPLDDYSENDCFDVQEPATFAYKELVERYLSSAKRIKNDVLNKEICSIDTNVQHIWQAKILRIKVLGVIDHINELVSDVDSGIYRTESIFPEHHFENQKSQLLELIHSAEFTIWVAVAWMTDQDLANALVKKARKGVNVRVVINKDNINNKIGLYLNNKVELLAAPAEQKLMHHKFCIIDMKIVAHGSYNWTDKAAHINDETLEISYSVSAAEKFSREFVELVKTLIV